MYCLTLLPVGKLCSRPGLGAAHCTLCSLYCGLGFSLSSLLSDLRCGCFGLRHLHDGEFKLCCSHPLTAQLQHSQHPPDHRHHHHLRVLPGISRRTQGEPLSPPIGNTHTNTQSRAQIMWFSAPSDYFIFLGN